MLNILISFILFSTMLPLEPFDFKVPHFQGQNYKEIRALINAKCLDMKGEKQKMREIKEEVIPLDSSKKMKIRVYYPLNFKSPSPAILLIHGGAWLAGTLETHDPLARYLAHHSSAVVFSLEYSLSPEAKFPKALEECLSALNFIHSHRNTYQITEQIALFGDSAGGNLVAGLSQWMKDKGIGPKIDLQVLLNPALDLFSEHLLDKNDPQLKFFKWQAQLYISSSEDLLSPYVSPIYSQHLNGLPPTLILVAENDPLKLSAEQYAKALENSEVEVDLYCQKGAHHLAGQAAQAAEGALESINYGCKCIRRIFHSQ